MPTGSLGLRYSVLKRDAAGQYQEVDADTNFRSGDRVRIQVDANTSSYLYVVVQGSSGNWQLLFPSADFPSTHIQRGQPHQLPSNSGQFVFDEQAGTEKVFLVLTRQPEPDLDKLIYALIDSKEKSPVKDQPLIRRLIMGASVPDDVIERLRSSVSARDLVFEKADSPDRMGRVEKAAYVVNTSTAPDTRLVVDLPLRHQ